MADDSEVKSGSSRPQRDLAATKLVGGDGSIITQTQFLAAITVPGAADKEVSELFDFQRPAKKTPQRSALSTRLHLNPKQHDVLYALAGCIDVAQIASAVKPLVRMALSSVYSIDKDNLHVWFKNRRIVPKEGARKLLSQSPLSQELPARGVTTGTVLRPQQTAPASAGSWSSPSGTPLTSKLPHQAFKPLGYGAYPPGMGSADQPPGGPMEGEILPPDSSSALTIPHPLQGDASFPPHLSFHHHLQGDQASFPPHLSFHHPQQHPSQQQQQQWMLSSSTSNDPSSTLCYQHPMHNATATTSKSALNPPQGVLDLSGSTAPSPLFLTGDNNNDLALFTRHPDAERAAAASSLLPLSFFNMQSTSLGSLPITHPGSVPYPSDSVQWEIQTNHNYPHQQHGSHEHASAGLLSMKGTGGAPLQVISLEDLNGSIKSSSSSTAFLQQLPNMNSNKQQEPVGSLPFQTTLHSDLQQHSVPSAPPSFMTVEGRDCPQQGISGRDCPQQGISGRDCPQQGISGRDCPQQGISGRDCPQQGISGRDCPQQGISGNPAAMFAMPSSFNQQQWQQQRADQNPRIIVRLPDGRAAVIEQHVQQPQAVVFNPQGQQQQSTTRFDVQAGGLGLQTLALNEQQEQLILGLQRAANGSSSSSSSSNGGPVFLDNASIQQLLQQWSVAAGTGAARSLPGNEPQVFQRPSMEQGTMHYHSGLSNLGPRAVPAVQNNLHPDDIKREDVAPERLAVSQSDLGNVREGPGRNAWVPSLPGDGKKRQMQQQRRQQETAVVDEDLKEAALALQDFAEEVRTASGSVASGTAGGGEKGEGDSRNHVEGPKRNGGVVGGTTAEVKRQRQQQQNKDRDEAGSSEEQADQSAKRIRFSPRGEDVAHQANGSKSSPQNPAHGMPKPLVQSMYNSSHGVPRSDHLPSARSDNLPSARGLRPLLATQGSINLESEPPTVLAPHPPVLAPHPSGSVIAVSNSDRDSLLCLIANAAVERTAAASLETANQPLLLQNQGTRAEEVVSTAGLMVAAEDAGATQTTTWAAAAAAGLAGCSSFDANAAASSGAAPAASTSSSGMISQRGYRYALGVATDADDPEVAAWAVNNLREEMKNLSDWSNSLEAVNKPAAQTAIALTGRRTDGRHGSQRVTAEHVVANARDRRDASIQADLMISPNPDSHLMDHQGRERTSRQALPLLQLQLVWEAWLELSWLVATAPQLPASVMKRIAAHNLQRTLGNLGGSHPSGDAFATSREVSNGGNDSTRLQRSAAAATTAAAAAAAAAAADGMLAAATAAAATATAADGMLAAVNSAVEALITVGALAQEDEPDRYNRPTTAAAAADPTASTGYGPAGAAAAAVQPITEPCAALTAGQSELIREQGDNEGFSCEGRSCEGAATTHLLDCFRSTLQSCRLLGFSRCKAGNTSGASHASSSSTGAAGLLLQSAAPLAFMVLILRVLDTWGTMSRSSTMLSAVQLAGRYTSMVQNLSPQVLGEEAFDAAWSTLIHMGALEPVHLNPLEEALAAGAEVQQGTPVAAAAAVVLYKSLLPLPETLQDAFAAGG